ncbi:MAG TPA: hypothetical protein VHN77_09905 [Phycisphaerales bacterium]|nr:hypothetical protein [Phycisphaerales bacterium]
MSINADNSSRRRGRAGLTLVEAVLSLLVLAVLATASLSAISQSRAARLAVDEQSMGSALARSLLSEIAALPSMESASTTIGVDGGENASDRTTFDDVDDFNGFSESPCIALDGKVIDGTDAWQRSVVVAWVSVSATTTTTTSDTGLKRVWVTVSHNGRAVTRLSALRGKAWDDMLTAGGL